MNDICVPPRRETAREEPRDSASAEPETQPEPMKSRQFYFQVGHRFIPADPAMIDLRRILPPGTYSVGQDERGFFLEQVDNFVLPSRLYGDVEANARRILDSFLTRPSGTGVLLSGNKGSGKTMLAKRIAQLGQQEHGLITVIISSPLCGEEFNLFLQGIQQPAVVIFDEFEKVYDREAQPKLLTVFDGTYASKKLFILTCNDRYRVDSHMHNRPGRIFYAIEFGGLSAAFIREYCEANLVQRANLPGVINVGAVFSEFSFDMLQALVEEMNRYRETATQAMRILNIKPQADSGVVYTIKVLRNGKELLADHMYPAMLRRSPLSLFDEFELVLFAGEDGSRHRATQRRKPAARPGYVVGNEELKLTTADLLSVDSAKGVFVFKTQRPDTQVLFTRETPPATGVVNYDAL